MSVNSRKHPETIYKSRHSIDVIATDTDSGIHMEKPRQNVQTVASSPLVPKKDNRDSFTTVDCHPLPGDF